MGRLICWALEPSTGRCPLGPDLLHRVPRERVTEGFLFGACVREPLSAQAATEMLIHLSERRGMSQKM